MPDHLSEQYDHLKLLLLETAVYQLQIAHPRERYRDPGSAHVAEPMMQFPMKRVAETVLTMTGANSRDQNVNTALISRLCNMLLVSVNPTMPSLCGLL